jgi:sulfoxide reductase heme-binding subunit YedZ
LRSGVSPPGVPRHLALIKAALLLLALAPLARLVGLTLSDQLGANPVEFITRSTGTWTLVLLLCTLAITPLRRLSGVGWLIRLRRMLGLTAFVYATLHALTWVWLDQWFDPASMLRDVVQRPFVTAGFAALLLLLPLALTSTDAMMRRLGRRWGQLHRLVYVALVASLLHYWWHKQGKNDWLEPALYALVGGLLLAARWLPGIRRSSAKSDSTDSRSRMR